MTPIAAVRDPHSLSACTRPGRILGIKEDPTDDRTQQQADAVTGLGQIDPGCGKVRRPQTRRIGVGNRLQKGQPGGDHADAQQEGPERGNISRRNEPEPARRDDQKPGDDPALVSQDASPATPPAAPSGSSPDSGRTGPRPTGPDSGVTPPGSVYPSRRSSRCKSPRGRTTGRAGET